MTTLAHMKESEKAVIERLDISGPLRMKLMDIGLIPGTVIECLQKSPLGDPVAFRICSAVIALRYEDSSKIFVAVNQLKCSL